MEKLIVHDSIKINHPLANKISVQDSSHHYCISGKSSEIAFFINKNFQTKIVKEFAKYTDNIEGDTRVYSFVPNELVEEFLNKYRA